MINAYLHSPSGHFQLDTEATQIPDKDYRTPELEAVPYHSFKELIDDVLAHGNESVTLPSNLVLMYQSAT